VECGSSAAAFLGAEHDAIFSDTQQVIHSDARRIPCHASLRGVLNLNRPQEQFRE
jgi:hypothetical protein